MSADLLGPLRAGLPAGLTARPAVASDHAAVVDLVRAYEVAVLGEVLVDPEDVEADWGRPGFDLERDCVVVLADGELLGWGEVFQARRATRPGAVRGARHARAWTWTHWAVDLG